MKILDKYILKKLFKIFFFILISAAASIEMIDFVNNMEYFKSAKLNYKEILGYYVSYTPYMLNFVAPIVSFMSTVMVTLVLSGNSEIIASLSIGIRFRRLFFPYIFFALIGGLLSFAFCGWIIPNANKKRVIFEINYLTRRSYNNLKNIHIKIDEDKYVYVQSFNAYTAEGYNFTLESIEDKLNGKLFAEKIKWIPEKGIWRAYNWTLRKIGDMKEELKTGSRTDLDLNLDPADFGGNIMIKEMVNMRELDMFIENLKQKKSDALYLFKVEKYMRYMYPFSIILLVMVGMIFSSRKMRGGAIWQGVLSFLLSIAYIAMFMFAGSRAESHSSNLLLTIWMPNILFTILVALIYRFMPK